MDINLLEPMTHISKIWNLFSLTCLIIFPLALCTAGCSINLYFTVISFIEIRDIELYWCRLSHLNLVESDIMTYQVIGGLFLFLFLSKVRNVLINRSLTGLNTDLEKAASSASGDCGHFVGHPIILRKLRLKYMIEDRGKTVEYWDCLTLSAMAS